MSYQVLARKWRPKTFREMVGQEHVLKALINALDHNRLHHAYLFTGTRGVGKTTIARILAKCLNCESGVSSEPCGQCSFCCSIAEGRFVDLIEVDAASRTKVEDTRELLENVQYAPTSGRYKVFLIDEVHMLSTHSFNALLKTLEEPPPHVKFLLATTDPQKLPATILSRCLQFNLKNMTPERVVGHLQNVLDKEMVVYEEPALWQLGKAADGSMRDALSLTDQAIAFGSGKLTEADVSSMLGTIDHTAVYDILDALAQAQGPQLLAAVKRLSEHAPDYNSALEGLLSLLHRIAIAQAVPGAIENNVGDRERIVTFASGIPAEDIQLFYQLALNGRRDLPLAPDARSGFEMILLRMLAFRPAGVAQLPQGSVNQSSVNPGSMNQSSAAAVNSPNTQEVAPVKKPEPAQIPVAKPAAAPTASSQAGPGAVAEPSASPSRESRSPIQHSEPVPAPATVPPTTLGPHAVVSEPQAVVSEPQAVVSEPQAATPAASVVQEQLAPAPVTEPVVSAAKPIDADADTPTASQSGLSQAQQVPESILATAENTTTPIPAPTSAVSAVSIEPVTLSNLSTESWNVLFDNLGFGGVVGNIASHCILEKVDGDNLFLLLDQSNATLFNESYTERIQAHLSVALNAPLNVMIRVAPTQLETPAAYKVRLLKERKQYALDMMRSDPYVQCLINDFSATLDAESVEPVAVSSVPAN
jgi:DNA polymerase III subunit gamma/tau